MVERTLGLPKPKVENKRMFGSDRGSGSNSKSPR
jgi:hypothetical protein